MAKANETNETKEEVKVVTEEKKNETKPVNKNNGIICIVIGVVLVVALIVAACIMFIKKGGQEASLSKSLESMGKDFYENFYYTQVGSTDEERANFLSKYETIGIKINLDNLSRYDNNKNSDKINKFVNNKTNKACDRTNTRVIVYPQKPYNKTSYKIETQLDCGFDEAETK